MTLQTVLKAAGESGMAHNNGIGGEFILVGTEKQLEQFEAKLQESGGYVPGMMVCDKCVFSLTRRILSAQTGAVGENPDLSPEPCPNGCGPLRPKTWREHALEGWECAADYGRQLRNIGGEE